MVLCYNDNLLFMLCFFFLKINFISRGFMLCFFFIKSILFGFVFGLVSRCFLCFFFKINFINRSFITRILSWFHNQDGIFEQVHPYPKQIYHSKWQYLHFVSITSLNIVLTRNSKLAFLQNIKITN